MTFSKENQGQDLANDESGSYQIAMWPDKGPDSKTSDQVRLGPPNRGRGLPNTWVYPGPKEKPNYAILFVHIQVLRQRDRCCDPETGEWRRELYEQVLAEKVKGLNPQIRAQYEEEMAELELQPHLPFL